ncbi:MAG: sigma-70 family RNA polymerase sigma factor [Thermoguttaceae bacterium]
MPFDVAPFCCDHFPCHAEWDRIAEDMGIWRLSPAETWRARRLIAGHSEESIARDEGLSVGIVRAEDAALYAKLGVRSREELIAMARAAHDKRLAEGNPPGGCPRRHPAARMMAAEEIRVGSLFVESRMAAVKFALRLAGNRKELAEEIVAAAWFLAVSNWQTYDRAKPFRPWLFQIMCHALYHMNHCAEQAEGGGAPDCPVLGAPDTCPGPAAEAESRDLLDKLRALVAALPDDARTMLHKLFWEDQTQGQVAEEQGDSQPTVSRHVAGILATLKEAIEDAAPPPCAKANNPAEKNPRNSGQIVNKNRPSRLYRIDGEKVQNRQPPNLGKVQRSVPYEVCCLLQIWCLSSSPPPPPPMAVLRLPACAVSEQIIAAPGFWLLRQVASCWMRFENWPLTFCGGSSNVSETASRRCGGHICGSRRDRLFPGTLRRKRDATSRLRPSEFAHWRTGVLHLQTGTNALHVQYIVLFQWSAHNCRL